MWQFPTKYWDSRFHWSLRDPETLGLVLEWCLWTGVNSSCSCWLAFALHLTTFPTKSRTWIWMVMSRLTEEEFLALFPSTVRKRGGGTSKDDGVRVSVNLLFHRSNNNNKRITCPESSENFFRAPEINQMLITIWTLVRTAGFVIF